MTECIPGRIYSGIVGGVRTLLICADDTSGPIRTRGFLHAKPDENNWRWRNASIVHDVRGPLVVLDLSDVDVEYAVKMMRECGCDVNVIADQIEEQTRPPLQVGVHLAWSRSEGRRAYMCWDGNFWWYSDSNKSLADWESVHYIGPASGDDDD